MLNSALQANRSIRCSICARICTQACKLACPALSRSPASSCRQGSKAVKLLPSLISLLMVLLFNLPATAVTIVTLTAAVTLPEQQPASCQQASACCCLTSASSSSLLSSSLPWSPGAASAAAAPRLGLAGGSLGVTPCRYNIMPSGKTTSHAATVHAVQERLRYFWYCWHEVI